MTGFGRAEGKIGPYLAVLELKSVNHRYLDARFRTPSIFAAFEIRLLEILRSQVNRGSFEITLRTKMAQEEGAPTLSRFMVDQSALESFLKASEIIQKQIGSPESKVSLEAVLQTNRILIAQEDLADTEPLWQGLSNLFRSALNELLKVRKTEGEKLNSVLNAEKLRLALIAEDLAKEAKSHTLKIREKLNERIETWELDHIDDTRRATEVAFFADRSDITEEIQRLTMHLEELTKRLISPSPEGRRLDFLAQELHREVNTIAAKSDSIALSSLTIEAKASIEKLREQSQNVE